MQGRRTRPATCSVSRAPWLPIPSGQPSLQCALAIHGMMGRMRHRHAYLAIHAAALLFGLTGIFGELIKTSAVAISMLRAAFAVVTLLALTTALRRPVFAGLSARRATALLAAGALLAIHWVTFFIAVKAGGVAVATLGFASFPAFIALLEALLFRERVKLAEWTLVALVVAGLVLVTPSFDFADAGTMGLLWGIGSGLAFALLALANRRFAGGLDSLQVAGWQNAIVVALTLPFAASAVSSLSALDWFWLALLGIFCTGLSHYLFVSSLTRLNARTAGLVIALEPVYAVGFAWILFAQQPSVRMLFGGALIVAAVVWSGLRPAHSAERRR